MIDPHAIISSSASIDTDVEIGPFAVVESDVEIGKGTKIGANAILRSGTRIGSNVTIDSFSVIAGLPQDLSFDPNTPTYVRIGDRSTIRESSTVNRATSEGQATVVGENCYLMAVTHLGHDSVLGDNVIIGNNSMLGGFVTIGDNAFLGGCAGIHQFCRIGEGVMFGGQATATQDVPPFTILAERNSLFGLNMIGLKRRKHSREAIKSLKYCYRTVFESSGNIKLIAKELLEDPRANFDEARTFLEFFLEGNRGFANPRRKKAD